MWSRGNPSLQGCSWHSLWMGCLAASLGLLHEEPCAVKTHLGEEGSVAHVSLGMHSA